LNIRQECHSFLGRTEFGKTLGFLASSHEDLLCTPLIYRHNIHATQSRWLLYPIVGLLLLANMINLGADLGAMAAAVNLLVGGPVGLYVVAFAVGCTWLEIFSRYQRYVSVLKWGSFVLLAY